MKIGLMSAILFFFYPKIFSQVIIGHYEGAITRDGSVQLVSFDFKDGTNQPSATYTIPDIGFYQVPVEKYYWKGDTLFLKFFYNFVCFFNKANQDITGNSVGWDPKLRLHIKKTLSSPEKKFTEEEISFRNNDVTLSGVLFKPANATINTPYVILIHGSDLQDRYTPYYHSLGYVLANEGIGVLLYDKRGCGRSTGSFENASLYDLAGDAEAALTFLRVKKSIKSKIGFLGTSQGGWISAIAASKYKKCSFVIFNVGPSVSVFQQEKDRIKYAMLDDGFNKIKVDSALSYTDSYFNYVRSHTAQDWNILQQKLNAAKASSWQDYVNIPSSPDDSSITWWSKNDYDPADDLKRLSCPVLSLFGEKDGLVPPASNQHRMDSLLSIARIKYQIKVFPGCAHDMLTYQGLNGPNWNWPTVYWQWRMRPQDFYPVIINWIKGL